MLQIVTLTPAERKAIDPLGIAEKWYRAHFSKATTFERVSPLFTSDPESLLTEFYETSIKPMLASRHGYIAAYDAELMSKIGRQGGHTQLEKAEEILRSYYEEDGTGVCFGDTLKIGVDYILRDIQSGIDRLGYPRINHDFVLRDTAAGLPKGGSKLNPWVHLEGNECWRHVEDKPSLINTRFMRSKLRLVFCNPTTWHDYLEPPLAAVRGWLKVWNPRLFAAWLDPRAQLQPKLAKALVKGERSLETDFKGMDMHLTWPVVEHTALPIYELLLPEGEYLHVAQGLRDSFRQPVYIPPHLWTGEHAAFSGQTLVSDCETIYVWCVYTGAWIRAGRDPAELPDKLSMIGDDVILTDNDIDTLDAVYEFASDEFERNHLILERTKTRKGSTTYRFCRTSYGKSILKEDGFGFFTTKGAYPIILAMNSCLQPEQTQNSRSAELLACCARLDNASGHPLWRSAVEFLVSHMKPEMRTLPSGDLESIWNDLQTKDWWSKVYGTDALYSLKDSPSYRLYVQLVTGKVAS